MKRIFPDYVYGNGPRAGCYWTGTCEIEPFPQYEGGLEVDVAIIGGGFTGLNAALTLAEAGVSVAVFEAQDPGWGASGRNGGFCCLGGGKLSDYDLDRRYGKAARLEWRQAELRAVQHVETLVGGADVERHSDGETWLAHRAWALRGIEDEVRACEENYGVTPTLHSADDLTAQGMSAGFHGGLTVPIGFGLNPQKFLNLLVKRCQAAGVQIFAHSPVIRMQQSKRSWTLTVAGHPLCAEQVLLATNGYSAEQGWISGRYMPVQSSVLVTRPLSSDEREAQGWTSDQMCYDSRNLLHYFRLMPNNRMLFGMRGGLGGSAGSDQKACNQVHIDFCNMFPAWRDVEIPHRWSGMVAMTRKFMPFVGPVAGQPGLHASFAYHGNGVAMGSFCGHLAAKQMLSDVKLPAVVRTAPRQFPLGKFRRALMWPVYAWYGLQDR